MIDGNPNQYDYCYSCGHHYIRGMIHSCFTLQAPYQPVYPQPFPMQQISTSLDTNPLFLALLKRVEKLEDIIKSLEARVNGLQTDDNSRAATLTFG